MRPAPMSAAVVLLAAAWWWRRQSSPELLAIETGNEDQAAAFPDADPYAPDDASLIETMTASALTVANAITGASAATMSTSPAGLAHMKLFEGLMLQRYRLGDGGWTIGYGRYYPDGGPLPPERIDQATADAWFAQDVKERGERWVRAYVTVDLTQPQFDALVSMAYNLSPRSFRQIADQVNAGNDPEAVAMQFTRPGTKLEKGLRRRRDAELAMFRTDPAYYG